MSESFNTITNELSESWKNLRQHWQVTTEVWNDPVRWQFEKEFWQPLEIQVNTTRENMKRLVNIIAQAQRNIH